MRTIQLAGSLLLGTMLVVGCSEQQNPTAPEADALSATPLFNRAGGAVHHVSVSGADVFCEAFGNQTGCDANLSLVANEFADGSARGQWQDVQGPKDEFGPPPFPVHIAIDCLHVVGNEAWVSGAVTLPSFLSGIRVLSRMADNGSTPNDPLDQVSFLHITEIPCTDAPTETTDVPGFGTGFFVLYDLTNGQVVVR